MEGIVFRVGVVRFYSMGSFMNEKAFWGIIDRLDLGVPLNTDRAYQYALDTLMNCSEEDIISFEEIMAEKLYRLDTREFAKAIYAGDDQGISGDCFLYARCYIVARGERLYQEILRNPSAAPRESEDCEFGALLNLAAFAYERKTGREFRHITEFNYESCFNKDGWK